ncbi:TnpV protein [Ruminiclostridium cellulolyticum]|uniref:TnpV protein n=1 Tax=Ruminiclostridium cellulolyticum TaxID=1521 RepID=UPI003BF592FB
MRTKYIEGIGLVEYPETPEEIQVAMNKETETIKNQEPISKAEYREGSEGILYPVISPDENPELEGMPEGIFAAEAVKYLVQNYPKRVQEMKIQGIWFSTIYQVDTQAVLMMQKIQEQLKQQYQEPKTDNYMELARYYNWIRETAQEIVMKEVVRIPR